MKIIHFISNLGAGGAERLVVDLCNELSKNEKNEVTLCVFYEKETGISFEKDLSSKVRYVNLKKTSQSAISFQKVIFTFLMNERPDIVNTHLSGSIVYLYLPLLFFNRTKFFHTIHNLAEEEVPGKTLRFFRKIAYKSFRLTPISISKVTQLSHLKLYDINTPLIYNGARIQGPTKRYEEVKEEIFSYKRNDKTKVFLTVGRINSPKDQKNFGLLLNVFKRLNLENKNAVLLIVGSDTSVGQIILKKLMDLKSENSFFIGPKENVSDYMLNSDYFCLSSKFEGLPITIIEALSYGLPIISTDVGGIPELIAENKNGLLVKSLDPNDYYSRIIELINWDEKKIAEVRHCNRQKYLSEFSIEITAKNYIELYEKLN